MSRPPFVSQSRTAGLAAADARRAWLTLLSEVRLFANQVRDGSAVDRHHAASVARLVILPRPAFPLGYLSAQAAAKAFQELAKAFVESGWSPALAGFVEAGAECLEAMLIADGHAQAEAGLRRMGLD